MTKLQGDVVLDFLWYPGLLIKVLLTSTQANNELMSICSIGALNQFVKDDLFVLIVDEILRNIGTDCQYPSLRPLK